MKTSVLLVSKQEYVVVVVVVVSVFITQYSEDVTLCLAVIARIMLFYGFPAII